ncbi:MAG: PSD1 and planctomycete cytochrome C domain-containing protein, partial [Verrucomicrobiota bacterium]
MIEVTTFFQAVKEPFLRKGIALLLGGLILASNVEVTGNEVGEKFYADQVFPILKQNCFECHGGEDKLRGHFRITSREGLLEGGDFGPAYDEEDPATSLLLEMVSYKDAEHQMPPKGKLPDESTEILKQWVALGAPYDPTLEIKGEGGRRGFTVTEGDRNWWAYRPLSGDEPPKLVEEAWSGNGIDAFVKSQLDREGLEPNLLADPQVLIRRLYYDLLGLPPTPDEVAQFVEASEDDRDTAYAALVEDLLARPQYGEKWGRHWLDVVRYAESNGFERDNPKPHIWRYRDYVIDAFNKNKPYDEFLIEQLAGDEIAEPTLESMTATGYHRLMQWDDEPADRRQHVYDVLADNVLVTSEAFLATTLNCARCHDHKADPISQKDYYAFMGIFHGVTHYKTEGTLVSWASERERHQFEVERKQKLAELVVQREVLEAAFSDYLDSAAGIDTTEVNPVTFIESAPKGGAIWEYTTSKPTPDWSDVGFRNKAWYKGKSGFGLKGPMPEMIQTEWNADEIWMRTTFGLKTLPQSLILEIFHDEDAEVYLNGHLIYEAKGFTRDYELISLDKEALEALQTGRNVIAVHCRHGVGGRYIDLALRTSASARSIGTYLSGSRSSKMKSEVKQALGQDLFGEYEKVTAQIVKTRKAQPGIPLNVVTELGQEPRPMHVHLRGSAHAMGDEIAPGVPAVLSSEGSDPKTIDSAPVSYGPQESSGRRLALAEWMVGEGSALTSRVMVNRIWQHHFGRGIVPSSSDFGTLGEKPTHPELLDWLAGQFIEGGWDIKEMHRLMLHSRTYRLSSEPSSASLAQDPQNHHLWRFSMRRLTAEELRDSVLTMSGKLNLERAGEWVYPPLPAEVLATASRPGKGWPVSKNEDDHFRRSVYVHVKRSLRHQMLADFDQADTDTTCAVRFVTTVPTQALTMLNSKFINDQATLFADRMRESSDDLREQIGFGLGKVMQRPPRDEEVTELVT